MRQKEQAAWQFMSGSVLSISFSGMFGGGSLFRGFPPLQPCPIAED